MIVNLNEQDIAKENDILVILVYAEAQVLKLLQEVDPELFGPVCGYDLLLNATEDEFYGKYYKYLEDTSNMDPRGVDGKHIIGINFQREPIDPVDTMRDFLYAADKLGDIKLGRDSKLTSNDGLAPPGFYDKLAIILGEAQTMLREGATIERCSVFLDKNNLITPL